LSLEELHHEGGVEDAACCIGGCGITGCAIGACGIAGCIIGGAGLVTLKNTFRFEFGSMTKPPLL
jgi:hypothetical protein